MSFNFEDNFKTPQRKTRRTDGDHLSIPEVPEVPHAPRKKPRPSNFGALTSTNLSNPHRFGNPFIFPNIDYEKCKLCEVEEENRMLRHQIEDMRNVEEDNLMLRKENLMLKKLIKSNIDVKKQFIGILNAKEKNHKDEIDAKERNHKDEINKLKKIIEELSKEAYENDLLNCLDK